MKFETFLNVGFPVLGLIAFISFCVGSFYFFFQETARRVKVRLGHYDEHHETRKEIKETGIKLITLAAAIVALLYTGSSYQLSRREFNARNRPFIRVEPAWFGGTYYQVSDTDKEVQIQFRFKISNVGPIPAYAVKVTERLQLTGELVQELKEKELIIFPGDSIGVIVPFSSNLDLKQKIQTSELAVSLYVDYRGVGKKPYFTDYKFRFPNMAEHYIDSVDADRPE